LRPDGDDRSSKGTASALGVSEAFCRDISIARWRICADSSDSTQWPREFLTWPFGQGSRAKADAAGDTTVAPTIPA
jgi:hypothetical protein